MDLRIKGERGMTHDSLSVTDRVEREVHSPSAQDSLERRSQGSAHNRAHPGELPSLVQAPHLTDGRSVVPDS